SRQLVRRAWVPPSEPHPASATRLRRGREAEELIDGEPCGAVKPAQLQSQALAGSAKRAFDGEYRRYLAAREPRSLKPLAIGGMPRPALVEQEFLGTADCSCVSHDNVVGLAAVGVPVGGGEFTQIGRASCRERGESV